MRIDFQFRDKLGCGAWIEHVEPVVKEEELVAIVHDNPMDGESFEKPVRQIRLRVFCTKGWQHRGKHVFQAGYVVKVGRKKLRATLNENKNGN